MTSPVIAGVIFTFWMLFGMGYFYGVFHFTACQKGYFYGVLLWGVSKISWYFKTPHRNTPSFRLAASHELTNLMHRKLRFSPNFIARTRLRASTILANFFHTYINYGQVKDGATMHMLCHRTAALVRADSRRFPASDIPLRGGERYVLCAMERQRCRARLALPDG